MTSIFTSGVTWSIVAMFIVGGLEAVGVLPVAVGTTILGLLGITAIGVHNNQIKTGKIK